ncbi:MAG: phage shock protein operon transcriptional activator [Gammaproteobacteria bacterium]|nr:phage shock protein operon transcriptional activator [Gammaproteobacteria bacterium]
MANPKEPDRLIGESPAFLAVLEAVSQIAPLDKPVLVVGERGTGKELIASRLHYLSSRWDGEFLKLNCAAISDTLIESELFGHEAGAFTGAARSHQGRFERADGGTLFLDELANTSGLVQEKLLRVIEYGEFERVGGKRTLQVDVRLIAATNEDLPRLAGEGNFRLDLLDRLAFDVITLPPLRERATDIALLAEYFAINMASELGRDYFPGFAEAAQHALHAYSWPGNLRELKNVVERAVYRTDPDDPVSEIVLDPFESPYRPSAGTNGQRPTIALPIDLKKTVRDLEIDFVNRAMATGKFNQRRAAELLGLTYHQFRGYLKKYDHERHDAGPTSDRIP